MQRENSPLSALAFIFFIFILSGEKKKNEVREMVIFYFRYRLFDWKKKEKNSNSVDLNHSFSSFSNLFSHFSRKSNKK